LLDTVDDVVIAGEIKHFYVRYSVAIKLVPRNAVRNDTGRKRAFENLKNIGVIVRQNIIKFYPLLNLPVKNHLAQKDGFITNF
jgi:hypothetical protein